MKTKEFSKLEIGSGNKPSPGYLHVDINPESPDVDLVGDVRAIFIPQDYELGLYPDLHILKPSSPSEDMLIFDEIRALHFIEHIHWYNQPAMWRWFWQLLKHGGKLEIETPDLDFILKTLMKNRSRWWHRWVKPRGMKYPNWEHPSIKTNSEYDLRQWMMFKLYSGGSRDVKTGLPDYHLGVYDRVRLETELKHQGFMPSIRKRHGCLYAIAMKPQVKSLDYFKEAVKS